MSFSDDLADYTADDIIAALDCGRSAAYYWKADKRHPPEWQQKIFLRLIAEHVQSKPKVKKARKKPKGG